jgi:hypothetical protein
MTPLRRQDKEGRARVSKAGERVRACRHAQPRTLGRHAVEGAARARRRGRGARLHASAAATATSPGWLHRRKLSQLLRVQLAAVHRRQQRA